MMYGLVYDMHNVVWLSVCVCVCVCVCVIFLISSMFVDASGLLRTVTQFAHLAADTIVNGAATAHSAPVDQADCMYTHTLFLFTSLSVLVLFEGMNTHLHVI